MTQQEVLPKTDGPPADLPEFLRRRSTQPGNGGGNGDSAMDIVPAATSHQPSVPAAQGTAHDREPEGSFEAEDSELFAGDAENPGQDAGGNEPPPPREPRRLSPLWIGGILALVLLCGGGCFALLKVLPDAQAAVVTSPTPTSAALQPARPTQAQRIAAVPPSATLAPIATATPKSLFADVQADLSAPVAEWSFVPVEDALEWAYKRNILAPCLTEPLSFCPDGQLSQADMIVSVVSLKQTGLISNIPDEITQLLNQPLEPANRAQAAMVIKLIAYPEFEARFRPEVFHDLTGKEPEAQAATNMVDKGLLVDGPFAPLFCSTCAVSRGQWAVWLYMARGG